MGCNISLLYIITPLKELICPSFWNIHRHANVTPVFLFKRQNSNNQLPDILWSNITVIKNAVQLITDSIKSV